MAKAPDDFVSVDLVATIDIPNLVLIRLAVVRFHPSGEGHGSAYTFSCLLTAKDDAGWISAGSGKITPLIFRKIEGAMRAFGLKSIGFERRTRGKHRLRHHT